MEKSISININNKTRIYNIGITLEEIAQEYKNEYSGQIVAAKVNNQLRELSWKLDNDCRVEFIDLIHQDGVRIYIRSLTFLFIRACRELYPGCRVSIEHSLGKGLYCEIHGKLAVTPRQVNRIQEKMKEIVELNEPFERINVSLDTGIEIFREMGFKDKLDIISYRPEDTVNLYKCGTMYDYLYGYMVPSTGYLKNFSLKFYLPGIILRYPEIKNPDRLPVFEDNPKLFKVFREAEKWCRRIGVSNTAQLNKAIENGKGADLVRVSEAKQEKSIIKIADDIAEQRDRIHLILIAGPSSSGKTTFAQRLRTQLMVNGLNPVPISMDNYFLNREDVPFGEDGKQDLESIDVIDLELFNEHITRLIQGQAVELPHYNFQKGKREYLGNKLRINDDQPLIIEGIHGLNEKLTAMIPKENKFKIYISALTQLNIDDHNRIPTTDTRLIRRMVRDYKFRGTSIEETLGMWGSVRRGEEKYIFPFQEQADVMFNSAMVYELAVLKPVILPLLEEFTHEHHYYSEINRIKKFLKYFVSMGDDDIPNTSILREFIGGSCFHK